MKQQLLALCGAVCLLAACGGNQSADDKTASATTSTDTSMNKTMPTKEEPWVPIDSATEMKAWMEVATPGEEHKMMAASNGTWASEISMWMKPDAPPMTSKGSMVNKMIMEGRYQQSDFKGEFMGMPFTGMSIMAYDKVKKKYISSWVDNMGTGILNMEGTWDDASKSMTMTGTMIHPVNGRQCNVKEVFKVIDDKTQVMEMYGPDSQTGKEYKNMEIKLTKK